MKIGRIVAALAVPLAGVGLIAWALVPGVPATPTPDPVPYVEFKAALPLDAPRLDDAVHVDVPSSTSTLGPGVVGGGFPMGSGQAPIFRDAADEIASQFFRGDAPDDQGLIARAFPPLGAAAEAMVASALHSLPAGGEPTTWGQYGDYTPTAQANNSPVSPRGGGGFGGGGGGGGSSSGGGSGDQSESGYGQRERIGRNLAQEAGAGSEIDPMGSIDLSGLLSEAAAPGEVSAERTFAEALAVGNADSIDPLTTVSSDLTGGGSGSGGSSYSSLAEGGAGGGGSAAEVIATPEPASLVLFGSGLAVTAWRVRRQRSKSR